MNLFEDAGTVVEPMIPASELFDGHLHPFIADPLETLLVLRPANSASNAVIQRYARIELLLYVQENIVRIEAEG